MKSPLQTDHRGLVSQVDGQVEDFDGDHLGQELVPVAVPVAGLYHLALGGWDDRVEHRLMAGPGRIHLNHRFRGRMD